MFEVDGEPVRDRRGAARAAAARSVGAAGGRIADIIAESASYNIGSIQRNINTPLMALQFLDADYQPRFKFKHVDKPKPVFKDARDKAINDTPVFRVSTEMWTIEYQERDRNTIIRRPTGDDLPAHGRFWINPSNGSRADQRADRRRRRRDRDRHGELPVGAADGIPGARRNARVVRPFRRAHRRARRILEVPARSRK